MNQNVVINILAHLLQSYGVRNVVTCSGTRNAPIVVGLAKSNLKLHPIIDERVAAFVALGMAARKKEPVALVCTSGTALLNFAPAVAEAYYRNIPLIVVSADRPCRWIDQNEGQTIRQSEALGNIVKKSVNVPADSDMQQYQWYINRIINEVLTSATSFLCGPVHINVPIENPSLPYSPVSEGNNPPFLRKIETITPRRILSLHEVKNLAEERRSKKIAIIVGTQFPDGRLNKALMRISGFSNVVVFSEAQSNINGVKNAVSDIEAALSLVPKDKLQDYVPDILISIGGNVVSAAFRDLMRGSQIEHWDLNYSFSGQYLTDTYQHLTYNIVAEPAPFLNAMAAAMKRLPETETGFAQKWAQISKRASSFVDEFERNCPWSDFSAVVNLVKHLSRNVNLQVSNGMAIRYLQHTQYEKLHRVDCNRGCSGIDGSTATAVGAAIDCTNPTVLLSGDMSAIYDMNSMALDIIPPNFNIFVLNNNGGDIFRIISATRDLEEREKYISQPHVINFSKLSQSLNFEYFKIQDKEQLKKCCLKISEPSDRPRFFEIDTSSTDNAKTYRDFINYLKSKKYE